MSGSTLLDTFGFGANGWGAPMLVATATTIAVALSGFLFGAAVGVVGAWAKVTGGLLVGGLADAYTTVLRGVPDLLVIYLFYFGSSAVLTPVGRLFGVTGFISLPSFLAGALAIGFVSGAYQTEVFRGAFQSTSRGEIEAAVATGMPPALMLRRVVAPLVLRYALPGLGNIWQLVLKESALISVTGLVEIMRQAQVAAGSTRQPFTFYVAAAVLYMLISSVTGWALRRAERHVTRGLRRPA